MNVLIKNLFVLMLVYYSAALRSQPEAVSIIEVANGFTDGIGLANAGDGSNRMFIVKQTGQILIWDGQTVSQTPFLDVSSLISTGGEQGLLGLAFHPDYLNTGYFYINYTNIEGNTVIARYQVSMDDANSANVNSSLQVLSIIQPVQNHNGGDMHFDSQGLLYIATGDGGSGGAPAQGKDSLLGKILRINIDEDDFPMNANKNYAIPSDNPFAGEADGADEIWVMGLRNPWRFSFDRANGDILIGDVGEGAWEEVNYLSAATGGENFGWPCYEGVDESNLTNCQSIENYQFPVHALSHGDSPNNNCSMIGGYKLRDPSYIRLNGWYFFTDWCTGTLWAADSSSGKTWDAFNVGEMGTFLVTGFGEGENGELYVMSFWTILRIIDPDNDAIYINGFEQLKIQ